MGALELKIPPVAVFLMAMVLSHGLAGLAPDYILPPGFFRTLLIISLVAGGGLFGIGGVVAFHQHGTTHNPMRPERTSTMVTGGIYGLTRNPMYLGLALLLAGYAVHRGYLAGLAVVPAFILYITRFQIVPEERVLAARFGADFEAYRAAVRRWF
jgi:protein-S-isoprenylcysteine O-methyltransferase Ste14